MFTERTSLIIPTKNRSDQIIGLFNKLILLNLKFNEIIVVDSSDNTHSKKVENECRNNSFYYYRTRSSTAYQRNFGLKKVSSKRITSSSMNIIKVLFLTFPKPKFRW